MSLVTGLKQDLRTGLIQGLQSTIYGVADIRFVPDIAEANAEVLAPTLNVAQTISATDLAEASATMLEPTIGIRTSPSPTVLTSGTSDTNGTSALTASITPSANKLITMAVAVRRDASPYGLTPTITGCGLTWVLIDSTTMNSNGQRRLSLYRAMGSSPSTGQVTIDVNDGGANHIAFIWSIVEWNLTDTSGTNGSGAIVQSGKTSSNTTNVTTQTVTLAALENAKNANYTVVNLSGNNAVTPDDFAELSDAGTSTDAMRMADMWKVNDVAAAPSWTSTTAQTIAVEIKAADVYS